MPCLSGGPDVPITRVFAVARILRFDVAAEWSPDGRHLELHMIARQLTRGFLLAAVLMVSASHLQAQALDVLDGPQASAPQTMQVEGRGTVSAVSGTCPSVVLTVLGVPVTVTPATLFAGGQSCAQLVPGVTVEVRGALSTSGGVLAMTASTIEVEDDTEVEGEGRVTALSGTCPVVSLSVDGITVSVDALTRFAPAAASCYDLRVGTKTKVKAVPAPGGGYRARLIAVQGQREHLEGESRITGVSGSCPDATLQFGDVSVKLTAGTTFVGGSCSALQPGMRAQVQGIRDDGGPITAQRVVVTARRVRGGATVSQVSGTCPTLSLLVQGVRVTTNQSTEFSGGACGNIRVGTRLEVEGDYLSDGSVAADEVEIRDQPGGSGSGGSGGSSSESEHVEGEGVVASVVGTCPTKTFVVNGVAVSTTSTTIYEGGSCADLLSGRRVEAEGTRQNGTILAVKVEFKS